MKEIWGRSLWLYQGHFLLSYSCFLIFFFSFILAINYHYGIQSSSFLQFKNSFLLPHENSISFHRDFFFFFLLRRITFVILFHVIQSFAETYSWINGTNFCPWNKVTCDNMSDHHVIALQKIRLSAAF